MVTFSPRGVGINNIDCTAIEQGACTIPEDIVVATFVTASVYVIIIRKAQMHAKDTSTHMHRKICSVWLELVHTWSISGKTSELTIFL